MTREEMLARMTRTEFNAWRVLEEIEPFGERGHWFRAAMQTVILANAHRAAKTTAFKLEDFLPENLFQDPAIDPDLDGKRTFNFFMMLKEYQDAILDRQQREKPNGNA